MAEIKKRVLSFNSGRQIKLYGNSIAINKSLELSEGYNTNVLGYPLKVDNKEGVVLNQYSLSCEELQELADYNIRLWMDFKDAIRKHGINNPKVFVKDAIL